MSNDRGFFRLCPEIKHYPWGSPRWIPALRGEENPQQKPFAELWMGVHPLGPSKIENGNKTELLSDYIERHKTPGKSGDTLPFLFKILAAGKPLSLQVHPNATQAREGWEQENRKGIEKDAPERNYRDPNHKPEILCALSPFTALCGFREADESAELLAGLELPVLNGPLQALTGPGSNETRLRAFLRALFALGPAELELLNRALSDTPATPAATEGQHGAKGPFGAEGPSGAEEPSGTEDSSGVKDPSGAGLSKKLAAKFAALYPGDPGILAPFYLRILTLKPFEAIFLKAGVMHSYVEGLGVELMANSDNVLRGGLTGKHIDIPELFKILDFSPYTPPILSPPENEKRPLVWSYPLPEGTEFSLTLLRNSGPPLPYSVKGPSILCVTQGRALLKGKNGGEHVSLCAGESAFISAPDGLSLDGDFTAFGAGA
ncbi:MAG: mannose-6-phosphate isomerase, class I, partial [Spirochaetaceae bacterium]|nr:mannose-6-phosphate isomerase, class I [Spirochaetaceae bacterium]